MSEESQKKGVSRRTLVKGAAWAVPAVPIAVATPAYAASVTCLEISLAACREPGLSNPNEPMAYQFKFCNTCPNGDITITHVRKKKAYPAGDFLYTNKELTAQYEPDPDITVHPGADGCIITPWLYSSDSGTWIYVTYERFGTVYVASFQTPVHCPAALNPN